MPSKVFLVTGSSRGLGRAIAEAVLDSGHRLVATARDPSALGDLMARHGDAVRAVALDVTDPDAAAGAVAAATDAFGRLDVVVDNAGYADLATVEDVTLENFRRQIDTNFLGVVNVTKAALPVLRAQGSGHIVQVSSVGARSITPGLSAYQAAKAAVSHFSEVLAAEVAPLGIRVTVLEPGGMRTDWAGSSMSILPISEPYRPTVGPVAERMAGFATAAVGDPAKVARVLLEIVEIDDPPLRLLVGSDALRFGREADRQRAESDERWADLSRSTDRDDAVAPDDEPLATDPFPRPTARSSARR
jgi:NAD(P)-dependent dehydrogenase (short-subunit alcohol dehydrogenase family)